MARPVLYRVQIGEDDYLGTAEEVVDFMRRADGAPPGGRALYMAGIARRVYEHLGLGPVALDDEVAFLESLGQLGVAVVTTSTEPSPERVDRHAALGDGPLAYGPGVDPDDVDLP